MSILFNLSAVNRKTGDTDLDLDRGWHLIHYLLTHHAEGHGGDSPLADAIFGGEFVEDDDEVRRMTPPLVARVAQDLQSLTEATVRERFDPQVLRRLSIYDAHAWGDDDEDLAVTRIEELKAFYADAQRRDCAVLVYCEGVGKTYRPPVVADAMRRFRRGRVDRRRSVPRPAPVTSLWKVEAPLHELLRHELAQVPELVEVGSVDVDIETELVALFRIPFFFDQLARPFLIRTASEPLAGVESSKIDFDHPEDSSILCPQCTSSEGGWKTLDGLRLIVPYLLDVDSDINLELRVASTETAARQSYRGTVSDGCWRVTAWTPEMSAQDLEAALNLARDTDTGLLPRCASEEEERFLIEACRKDPGFGEEFDFRIENHRLNATRRWNKHRVGLPTPPHILAHYTSKLLLTHRLDRRRS